MMWWLQGADSNIDQNLIGHLKKLRKENDESSMVIFFFGEYTSDAGLAQQ